MPNVTNFVFGIADMSHLAKSVAKSLLRALSDGAESLRITIADDREPKLKLVQPVARATGSNAAVAQPGQTGVV